MERATRILVSFNIDGSVVTELLSSSLDSQDYMSFKYEKGVCKKFLVEYLDLKDGTVHSSKMYFCSQEEYSTLEKRPDVYYVVMPIPWAGGVSELW